MPSAPGRNEPCHCGSGKKYKQCHLGADEAAAREARAQGGDAAVAEPAEPAEPERAATAVPRPARPRTQQPWKRNAQNTRGFGPTQRAPRKVGGS